MNTPLTQATFENALTVLARRDPELGAVIREFGKPRIRKRSGGFKTLVLLILEQQVSLASANACYKRLLAVVIRITPEKILTLTGLQFRNAGISRQKTRYIRNLAEWVVDKKLNLRCLSHLSDDKVRQQLMQVTGIGPWTADVYLLTCLLRPDVWPVGDIALQAATQEVQGLEVRPNPDRLTEIGESWRPWRSVAARILWHHYLNAPRRK